METSDFAAAVARGYCENDVLVLGVGDSDPVPERFIILSRMVDPGPGDDSVGLQTHTTQWEIDDAVSCVTLTQEHLSIDIAPAHQDEVAVSTFSVDISAPEISVETIVHWLKRIFSETPVPVHVESK